MAIINKTEVDNIRSMYWDESMSAEDISKIYNCHCMTVLRFMKNNNIPIRNAKDRANTEKYKQKISETSMNRWIDSNYRNNQISKRTGKSSGALGKTWKVTTGRIYDVKGEKNPMWKGGKTKIIISIRTSDKYKEWRKSIFERDDYTCQYCGRKCKKGDKVVLECHHKIPLSVLVKKYDIKSLEDVVNNNHIFDISNGVTLCSKCHKETDSYGVNIKYADL